MNQLPPNNPGVEKAVLGCLLIENSVLDRVRAVLVEEDFYREAHRLIYKAILSLADRQEPFDLVTVNAVLTSDGTISGVGGPAYLATLVDGIPSAFNVETYARVVRTHALRRRLLADAQQLAADVQGGTVGVSNACSRLRQTAAAVESRTSTATSADRHRRWCAQLAKNLDGAGPFVSTGFPVLDEVLAEGFAPGNISIFFGRPGSGKTTLMSGFARNLARAGVQVTAFPNEKGADSFTNMMVCAETGIEIRRLFKRAGDPISDGQRHAMMDSAHWLIDAVECLPVPLGIRQKFQPPNLAAIEAFESAILGCRRQPQVVLVDLLDMTFDSLKPDEVSVALSHLRAFVRHHDQFHIALFHQCNRDPEKRKGEKKRPVLSDLRSSGKYEETGDLIVSTFRPALYEPQMAVDRLELHVLKQRLGMPAGPTVALPFDGACCRVGTDGERVEAELAPF